MDARVKDLYAIPNIEEYEDVCLLTLHKSCIVMEDSLRKLSFRLPEPDRNIIETDIDKR